MTRLHIPIDRIVAAEKRAPAGEKITAKLAASFKNIGQVRPIQVRPFERLGPGWYELIDGHHRVAAAKALGWTQIEAEIW